MSAPDKRPEPAFPDLFRDDVFRLETPRLWLRWPCLADASRLLEIVAVEAVARHTATWPHPFPEEEAAVRIEGARDSNEAGAGLVLALAEKSRPGRLIGLVGVGAAAGTATTASGCAPGRASGILELGYLLAVEHQGYGLMTEAVQALVGAVFRYSAADRIRGASGIMNIASRRVMEKAGFRLIGQRAHEAPARGGPVACDELELTREAWRGGGTARSGGTTTARPADPASACAA